MKKFLWLAVYGLNQPGYLIICAATWDAAAFYCDLYELAMLLFCGDARLWQKLKAGVADCF